MHATFVVFLIIHQTIVLAFDKLNKYPNKKTNN